MLKQKIVNNATLNAPEGEIRTFRCKVEKCVGWLKYNSSFDIKLIACPVCGLFNCLRCEAVHAGISCKQYLINKRQENEALEQEIHNIEMLTFETKQIKPSTSKKICINNTNLNFRCSTKNCKGEIVVKRDNIFKLIACSDCGMFNCTTCKVVHMGMSCKEYINTIKNVPNSTNLPSTSRNLPPYSSNPSTPETISQYKKIIELEENNDGIILNTEMFECVICYIEVIPGDGVILRECLHEFCQQCVQSVIKHSNAAVIKCPFKDDNFSCECTIQDREIKKLVDPEIYEQHINRSLREAQGYLQNGFSCKTPNCNGYWCYEDGVSSYICPLCKNFNCHQCKSIHNGLSCREYQDIVFNEDDPNSRATKLMFEEMLNNNQAMRCPTCKIVVTRDEGCSWIVCAVCKVEICWATRGPRWGPAGKDDKSGGCKCDWKNKKKCHPDCNYCH